MEWKRFCSYDVDDETVYGNEEKERQCGIALLWLLCFALLRRWKIICFERKQWLELLGSWWYYISVLFCFFETCTGLLENRVGPCYVKAGIGFGFGFDFDFVLCCVVLWREERIRQYGNGLFYFSSQEHSRRFFVVWNQEENNPTQAWSKNNLINIIMGITLHVRCVLWRSMTVLSLTVAFDSACSNK